MIVASIAQDFGYFFNSSNSDRKYSAESFEEWLKPFFVSGVFVGELEVTALSTPGMSVQVAPGYANLDGKVARWTSTSTLTIATASGVYDRIDTIVLRRDNTNRQISIDVVTGTAAASPEPTAPVRSSSIYELVLAQVLVGAGVTSIIQDNITDTRLDTDLCGIVCAAVQTPDFSDLYDQFTAQFNTWFEHMKDQLDEDAAGHLQLEIDAINLDIGGIESDVSDMEKTLLAVDTAFTIPNAGASVTYSMSGLTSDHQLTRWNFSSSAENNPPTSLSWSTASGSFTITNNGSTTTETIKPVFMKPAGIPITIVT